MFHSAVEASQKSWFFYEPFVLLSNYRRFQKDFVKAYCKYDYIVERYRNLSARKIFALDEEYLDTHPEIADENVALLRNAIELWRSAAQTTDAVAPILFHYSLHCFNSFFAYSFFRWEPPHSQSHGVSIQNFSGEIGEIKVNILHDGLFRRLIDAWTCLGTTPAFSAFLPFFENDRVEFHPNKMYFLEKSNCVNLEKLLTFNPVADYERKYWKEYGREELLMNNSLINSMNLPTRILQNYLILFAVSSVARYRPVLWSSVLSGQSESKSALSLAYRQSLLTYAQFDINSHSLLQQISRLMRDALKGEFKLERLP